MIVAWVAALALAQIPAQVTGRGPPPPAAESAPSADRRAVEAALADSAAGWNTGSMARFLAVYSDSPDASFTTRSGIVRGKAAMAERYARSYDFTDLAKRGRLTFQPLDFRPLGPLHALYVARFTLTYPDKPAVTGTTSLTFARERGGWRIIADHSS